MGLTVELPQAALHKLSQCQMNLALAKQIQPQLDGFHMGLTVELPQAGASQIQSVLNELRPC